MTTRLLNLGQELAHLLGPAWTCEAQGPQCLLREKAPAGVDLTFTLTEKTGRVTARLLLPDPGWYSFVKSSDSPAITFDPRRAPKVLAADIEARLLPEARKFLATAAEAKAIDDEAQRLQAANTKALCGASGGWLKPADHGGSLTAYLPNSIRVSAWVQSNDVRLELNWLPPALAAHIIALIAQETTHAQA